MPTMIDRHFHWRFVLYDGEPNAGTISWGVSVEVIGYLSEADARVAALDVVRREQCNLVSVRECGSCGYQQATASSMSELVERLKD